MDKKQIIKHYLYSILIYGIILLFLGFCPLFNKNIENPHFNYITVLGIYYIGYIITALPVLLKNPPQKSRSITIINYFIRQFKNNLPLEKRLNNFEPDTEEKQAFTILFIKAFFGVYCLSLLCNKYIPHLGYDIDFIKEMFSHIGRTGFVQFIDDTADMWLTLMFTVSTFIFAISYLTEHRIFKNEIKYADTTPAGLLSCLMCYYPLILITNQILPMNAQNIIPIEKLGLRITLYFLVIIVNLGSLIAILRLGTKAGNLTNRSIVTTFPYNIVRHPDYTMQMFYVILTAIPFYFMNSINIFDKIIGTLGIIGWLFIYYLRAITEERNLIKDSEYLNYTRKVQYRFIPKIF